MANNTILRQKFEEIQAQGKADREWWDKKRATTQAEFMKELEAEATPPQSTVVDRSDEDAVMVENPGKVGKKKKGKK